MTNLKIGWVGLGKMGTAMATNLLESGYDLKVFNRTRDKEKNLTDTGAISAKDLRGLVNTCEVSGKKINDDYVI